MISCHVCWKELWKLFTVWGRNLHVNPSTMWQDKSASTIYHYLLTIPSPHPLIQMSISVCSIHTMHWPPLDLYMRPKAFYFICMCAIKRIYKITLMTNCFVCITQARQYLINSRFIWVHCSTMCNMSLNIWKNACMWFEWHNCTEVSWWIFP